MWSKRKPARKSWRHQAGKDDLSPPFLEGEGVQIFWQLFIQAPVLSSNLMCLHDILYNMYIVETYYIMFIHFPEGLRCRKTGGEKPLHGHHTKKGFAGFKSTSLNQFISKSILFYAHVLLPPTLLATWEYLKTFK